MKVGGTITLGGELFLPHTNAIFHSPGIGLLLIGATGAARNIHPLPHIHLSRTKIDQQSGFKLPNQLLQLGTDAGQFVARLM